MSYSCENCLINTTATTTTTTTTRPPCYKTNYIFCKSCIKDKKFISITKCKKMFFLTQNDIKNLKFLYLQNNKNCHKFYLYDEIEAIIINKYGTLNKLDELKNYKHTQTEKKMSKKKDQINKRREELLTVLKENKLEFKNCGDCYSYINYGTPTVDTIILNQLNTLQDKQVRRISLANELLKYSVPLDEKESYCYEYINNIGCHDFNTIVENIVLKYYGQGANDNNNSKRDLVIKFD